MKAAAWRVVRKYPGRFGPTLRPVRVVHAVLTALTVALLAWALPAAARTCGAGSASLHFKGEPRFPLSTRTIRAHVTAGLRATPYSICPDAGLQQGPRPTGVVVQSLGDERYEVAARVGQRRLARKLVDLATLPPDARALALAIEIEELIVASFSGRRKASRPAPESPSPRIGEGDPAPHSAAVMLGPAGLVSAGGVTLIGGLLQGELPLDPGGVFLAIGGSGLLPERSTNGRISGFGLTAGFGGFLRIVRRASTALRLQAGLQLHHLNLIGQASGDAIARRQGAWLPLPFGGLALSHELQQALALRADASFGWPLRELAATDTGREATSVAGPTLLWSLGVAAHF